MCYLLSNRHKGILINDNVVKTKGTSIAGTTLRSIVKSIPIRPKGIEAMERFFNIWIECQTVKKMKGEKNERRKHYLYIKTQKPQKWLLLVLLMAGLVVSNTDAISKAFSNWEKT